MKVIHIDDEKIKFEDESTLSSDHYQDCCEHHYLDFSTLILSDFEGLDFDLSGDKFFERVPDFGIRLVPVNGHPVSVPGYGSNNGYYSTDLRLVLKRPDGTREYNIDDCQVVDW